MAIHKKRVRKKMNKIMDKVEKRSYTSRYPKKGKRINRLTKKATRTFKKKRK